MIICQTNKNIQTRQSCGFYITEKNQNTFLYQLLMRNKINNAITYFSELDQNRRFNKWLCPLYCDISLFDNYETTISKLRNTIEAKNGYYFFDLSIEAIPYDPIDSYLSQKFKSFHSMLEAYAIDPARVFFVNANLVADQYYDDWRIKNNVAYKIKNKILTHQYSLGGFSEPFKMYFNHDQLFTRNIELAEQSILKRLKRKYYFTCLMLRPRFHRTAIMLHLLERNHLPKGIVSYFGNEFGNKSAVTVEKEELSYNIIAQLNSGKRLLTVWDKLEKISPVMIDSTLTTIKEKGWAPKDLGFFPRQFIEDTSSLNARSYFEIVVETHFTNETSLYITEKTLWAIVSLQPFIITGSPYTLQYLRDLGFQTFSPYIDESYDTVSDPHQRIELIMNEIDRLCSMSIDEIHDLYSALWPRILHNYYHYFNHSKDIAAHEIQKRIIEPITLNEF